ncbi:hypothetical protein [Tautonia plasticadhaerens]|uniref:hypothetical protein n=1 Tax=Tautonia plasticadhaerens TaxID=2527974 RepID=UPI00119F8A74|nr:hypothetical protein [Tautonia plasticadhaerens]
MSKTVPQVAFPAIGEVFESLFSAVAKVLEIVSAVVVPGEHSRRGGHGCGPDLRGGNRAGQGQGEQARGEDAEPIRVENHAGVPRSVRRGRTIGHESSGRFGPGMRVGCIVVAVAR